MAFIFPYIGNVIIPTDSYFSEGLKPPTSYPLYDFTLELYWGLSIIIHELGIFMTQAPKAESLVIILSKAW